MKRKVTSALLAPFLLAAAAAAQETAERPVAWPAGELKWIDVAGAPPGVQQVMLRRDLKTGAFAALQRLPPGFSAPLHAHAANLRIVIISGTIVHGPEGEPEVRLGPGSYLMLPAKTRHTTVCDKASACVFFNEGDAKLEAGVEDGPKN